MADTTPIYALPFLELGDAPDIASATENLATEVEAELSRIDSTVAPLLVPGFQFIRKTADETVTSNPNLQFDDELTFTAAASTRYLVEVTLFVTVAGNNSTTDFQAGFAMPTGALAAFGGIGPDPAMTSGSAVGYGNWGALYGTGSLAIPLPFGLYTAGTTMITIKGIITNGTTAGTVRFGWSQVNASANGVTVKANSYMTVNKIA